MRKSRNPALGWRRLRTVFNMRVQKIVEKTPRIHECSNIHAELSILHHCGCAEWHPVSWENETGVLGCWE